MEIGERVSCKAAYLCRWIIYDAEQLSKVGTLREKRQGGGETGTMEHMCGNEGDRNYTEL